MKCPNFNCEIVLSSTLKHVEILFLKNCKNCIHKWILQVIFSRRCSNCPKIKIVHNFLITYPIGMNQSFIYRQKYNLGEKKFKNLNLNFETFVVAPRPIFWAYLDITFVHGHRLKKINIPIKIISFSIFQKSFKKSWQKISP